MNRALVAACALVVIILTLSSGAQGEDIPATNSPCPKKPLCIKPDETGKDLVVATGKTLKLAVELPSTEVTWEITWEVIGGQKSYGKVDQYSGIYTAPDEVPDNPALVVVTVKCNLKTSALCKDPISAMVPIIINQSSCVAHVSESREQEQPQKGRTEPKEPLCVAINPPTNLVVIGEKPVKLKATTNQELEIGDWKIKMDGKEADNHEGSSGGRLTNDKGDHNQYQAPGHVPTGKVEVTAKTGKGENDPSATAEIILVRSAVSAHCPSNGDFGNPKCKVIPFNRLGKGAMGKGNTGTIGIERIPKKPENTGTDATPTRQVEIVVTHNTLAREVAAVNSSKALLTGSILELDWPEGVNQNNCANYDWKIVTQAEESPNILIYNPNDIGPGICSGSKFVIALPVHVLWADVTAYPQQTDPQRTAPAKLSAFMDCWGQNAPLTIAPCDRHSGIMPLFYHLGLFYTHFVQAGSSQGTISLTPALGNGEPQLSFDVQSDPAYKIGPGWINLPFTFEKNTAQNANLDALISGVAYDFRALRHPNVARFSHFIIRKPQFQIRSSAEAAPTTPSDTNWVESGTIKFPLVFNFHQQPSAFTAYPVMGVEGGTHVDTHLADNNPIFRGVGGVDGSFRWPFNVTHNFLGSNPITFEYSYRVRWLAYSEPFTDVANNTAETLAGGRRSFFKGSLTAPFTANLQFQITALHGSLPPDFRALGNTVLVGFTFTIPGSSEH